MQSCGLLVIASLSNIWDITFTANYAVNKEGAFTVKLVFDMVRIPVNWADHYIPRDHTWAIAAILSACVVTFRFWSFG